MKNNLVKSKIIVFIVTVVCTFAWLHSDAFAMSIFSRKFDERQSLRRITIDEMIHIVALATSELAEKKVHLKEFQVVSQDEIAAFAKDFGIDPAKLCRSAETFQLSASGYSEFVLDASHKLYLLNGCLGGAYNTNVNAYVSSEVNGKEIVEEIELEEFNMETQTLLRTRQQQVFGPSFNVDTGILNTFYKGRGLGDFGSEQMHKWDEVAEHFVLLEWRFNGGDGIGEPGYVPVGPDQWPILYKR